MNRPFYLATLLSLAALHGCASAPPPLASGALTPKPESSPTTADTRQASNGTSVTQVAHVTEIPVEKDAPKMDGHPLTSVVVTQCNLIVAVYMTMPDGRLLRFDHSASVPYDQLLTMAYSATRSERVEVSCNDTGAAGYERHEPV
jgi:hypothetical protein